MIKKAVEFKKGVTIQGVYRIASYEVLPDFIKTMTSDDGTVTQYTGRAVLHINFYASLESYTAGEQPISNEPDIVVLEGDTYTIDNNKSQNYKAEFYKQLNKMDKFSGGVEV